MSDDLGEKYAKAQGACITCPNCGRTSYNPNDVRERFCGACHRYHSYMEEMALRILGNTGRYSVKDNETGEWVG